METMRYPVGSSRSPCHCVSVVFLITLIFERHSKARLTTAMESNKSLRGIGIELDVQRSRMSLESNTRGDMIGVASRVCYIRRSAIINKLVSNLEMSQIRKPRRRPDGVAGRIAVVAPLMITGTQDAVVVELFCRIVLVYVLPMTLQLIDRVLNRPDPSRRRVLNNANRVPQAPAENMAVEKVKRRIPFAYPCDVVAANLRMSASDVASVRVLVGVAAAGDEKSVWLFLGHEKRARGVVRVGHVSDEGEVGGEIN